MRFDAIAFVAPLLFVVAAATTPGCSNSLIPLDTGSDTADTADTGYQGARLRAPDVGWRVHIGIQAEDVDSKTRE